MSVESNIETDISAALADYRTTQEAHTTAKEHLSESLGALVGRRINISGFPTSAVIASSVDEEGRVLRRTTVPKYRSRFLDSVEEHEPRQPVNVSGQEVLAVNCEELHVSVNSGKKSIVPFDVVGYIFRMQGITAIDNIDQ